MGAQGTGRASGATGYARGPRYPAGGVRVGGGGRGAGGGGGGGAGGGRSQWRNRLRTRFTLPRWPVSCREGDPTRRRSGGAEADGEGRAPGGQAIPPPWLRARARRGRAAVAQGGRVGGGHVRCRGCGPGGGGANRGRRSRQERERSGGRVSPPEMTGAGGG